MSYSRAAVLSHEALISATIAEMQRQNAGSIRAAHLPNYTQPDQIGNYIPDVTGYRSTTLWIAEAESADGLAQQHTQSQWSAFHNHATRVGGYFIAVVAKADEVTARTLLQKVAGNSDRAYLWTF